MDEDDYGCLKYIPPPAKTGKSKSGASYQRLNKGKVS